MKFDVGISSLYTRLVIPATNDYRTASVFTELIVTTNRLNSGGVSEWPKEAVLKTAVPQGTVGSNPTPSVYIYSRLPPLMKFKRGYAPLKNNPSIDVGNYYLGGLWFQ